MTSLPPSHFPSTDASADHEPLTYAKAGVDIAAGDALVDAIRPAAARTLRPEVLAGIGGFGALFALPAGYQEPVLVSGTDGVGTKLKLAFQHDGHDTVGIDLVAMSVNDILVQGAEPLFFLDYFACGRLDVGVAGRVVQGIAEGCARAGCALVGGETAEMPGMYPDGEYDLAGFAVGVVEKSKILPGNRIQAGDVVLGLASSGAHSNGYSLIRRVLDHADIRMDATCGEQTWREALLAPTRIYVRSVLSVLRQCSVHGLAHITGGGLIGNVPRVLPPHLAVRLHRDAWSQPYLFQAIQAAGRISDDEMLQVFNLGIGMVMMVPASSAETVKQLLRAEGETVFTLGNVIERDIDQPAFVMV